MRVITVGADASLYVALTTIGDWDVRTAFTPDDAALQADGADVVLVGAEDSDAAFALAARVRELGVDLPVLVVGESTSSGASEFPVLRRPFSLDDLRAAVSTAVAAAPAARSLAQPDPPRPLRTPDEPLTTQNPSAHPPPPEPATTEPRAEAPADPPRPISEESEEASSARAEAPAETPPPDRGGAEVEAPRVSDRERRPAPQSEEPRSQARAEPVGFLRRRRRQVPDAVVEQPAPEPPPEPEPVGVAARLEDGLAALEELQRLLEEMPLLRDLAGFGDALLGELRDAFACRLAAVYVLERDHYRILAAYGLSTVERSMVVRADQLLFASLAATGDPVFVGSVERSGELVSGLGTSRADRLVLAPIAVRAETIGVLAVGGSELREDDASRLHRIALEAAPGFAISRTLRALR